MRVAFGSRVTAVPQRMASDPALYAVSALLFVASVALLIAVYAPMSARGGMAMPGGSTMSMTWMRPPGRTWSAAAASFVCMWAVMMAAMMLPSLVPMLRRYRLAVHGADGRRLGWLTALVGAGYFLVWTMVGMPAYAAGVALAEVAMRQPALARFAPMAIGVVVVIGGALQFTVWKARHLACCRRAPGPGRTLPADEVTALRHGLRLGVHCTCSCAGLMVILLVIGVMDLRMMAAVTVSITAERLVPGGERVAQVVGVVLVGAGSLLMLRAAAGG